MLVISRKTEEFVQIGENIIVKVIKSTNGSVKIGIEAPGNLRVIRGELQATLEPWPPLASSRHHLSSKDRGERERIERAEVL